MLFHPVRSQCLRKLVAEMTTSVVERGGNIGIVKGSGENEIFHPRGNFTLKIVAKVEGAKDGYVHNIHSMCT